MFKRFLFGEQAPVTQTSASMELIKEIDRKPSPLPSRMDTERSETQRTVNTSFASVKDMIFAVKNRYLEKTMILKNTYKQMMT